MATKKPNAKKTIAKKTAAKKATAKATPKTTTAKNPSSALKALSKVPTVKNQSANTRTQPTNPLLTDEQAEQILGAFNAIRRILEEAAANLRPLDRARLNGVGIKRQGFIERAFALAAENTQFLPQYLDIEQFERSFEYFVTLRALFDACTQLREFIWNLVVQAADISFTDAGEFYKSVQEAARRRIDGAESIYRELSPFFKVGKRKTENGEVVETQKMALRDARGLIKGTKNGKIVIENIKPKLIGGKHEIIDEKFTDDTRFKETEEGDIKDAT